MSQEYRTIQSNFSGGLVSPMAEGSIGSVAYQSGVGIAENVMFGPGYGFVKRPGSKYEATAKRHSEEGSEEILESRVFSYQYKGKTAFIEFFIDDDGSSKVRRITSFPSRTMKGAATLPQPSDITDVDGIRSVMVFGEKVYVVGSGVPCEVDLLSGTCRTISFVAPVRPSNPKEGDIRTYTLDPTSGVSHISAQMFYGGRWFLAVNPPGKPAKIYYSRAYDSETGEYRFNDFTYRQEVYRKRADGSFYWEPMELADLAGEYSDANMGEIGWMVDNNGIYVGTSNGIWSNGGNRTITSTVDSPLILDRVLSTKAAVSPTMPVHCELGAFIFFSDITEHAVRCITYTQQRQSFSAPVVSDPVSKYLKSGIAEMVAVDGPTPSIYVLTNSHQLLCCQFDSNQVLAWSRITFEGNDHAIEIFPIETPEVMMWPGLGLHMDRGVVATIESMPIPSVADAWDLPNVDCFEASVASVSHIVAALGNRDSVLLKVSEDSNGSLRMSYKPLPVSSRVQYAEDGEIIHVGFPYNMVVGTLRSELPANGTSQGAKRATANVTLRLYNSIGGEIGIRPELDEAMTEDSIAMDFISRSKEILYRLYGKDQYGYPYRLFTGDKTTQFSTSVLDDDRLVIISREPFPFCVAAIIVKHSVKEG